MTDPIARLNAALEGRYRIEREIGEGGMATTPRPNRSHPAVLALVLTIALPGSSVSQAVPDERQLMYEQYQSLQSYVRGGYVEPRWIGDEGSFWFVEALPEGTTVHLVDPSSGSRRTLFDIGILRDELRSILGSDVPDGGLPFSDLRLSGDDDALELTVAGRSILLDSESGTLSALEGVAGPSFEPSPGEVISPSMSSTARIEGYDVWLRSLSDGSTRALTSDGTEDEPWGNAPGRGPSILWSPDGQKLAVVRTDLRSVARTPIVSYLSDPPEVHLAYSWQSAGPFEASNLFVLDVATEARMRVDLNSESDVPERLYLLGWLPDEPELLFARVARDFRAVEVLAANAETGQVRTLFRETRETFFEIPVFRPLTATMVSGSGQFVWKSDRDGWRHLYLYDFQGNLVRRLTTGPSEVVDVLGIDSELGWVYFTAHSDSSRPYDTHVSRVSVSGGEVEQLTEGRGIHYAAFSPSMEFFVDTYTNVDLLPVVQLRSANGDLIDTLSVAEIDAPDGFTWVEPEEFVVKAADGETDLYGVLYKPYDFDPEERYPVVEIMVGRPTVAVNEILRTHSLGGETLAQLGFVVVALDARGTPERGHDFHDVVYGEMGRYEILDHAAALHQLLRERPYLDPDRVGVTGVSYGGYYAIRALLQAPDVYHVAVAVAPYDPQGDAVIPYMGLPRDNPDGYAFASNIGLADQLEGHLMIQHGSADSSALFAWTMQLVEALVQAGKPVDLVVLPDEEHGLGGQSSIYAEEARTRYLLEHLHGESP